MAFGLLFGVDKKKFPMASVLSDFQNMKSNFHIFTHANRKKNTEKKEQTIYSKYKLDYQERSRTNNYLVSTSIVKQ